MATKSNGWTAALVLSLLTLIQPAKLSAQQAEDDLPFEPTSILPFELHEGHIILAQLPLAGVDQPLEVMIDTGASHSVIDRKAAKRINAPRLARPPIKVKAFDGGSEAERVIVRGLRFAGRTLTIACYSADLPWDRVELMLGLDVLRTQDFRIDYAARQIIFAPANQLPQETPFALEEGLVLVDVQIGGHTYRLSIDSGAPMTSLDRDRCRASIKWLKGNRTAIRRFGGTTEVQTVTLSGMQIGNKQLHQVPAMIVAGSGKTGSVRDGVIGPKSLGFKAVQFDFANSRMGFEF